MIFLFSLVVQLTMASAACPSEVDLHYDTANIKGLARNIKGYNIKIEKEVVHLTVKMEEQTSSGYYLNAKDGTLGTMVINKKGDIRKFPRCTHETERGCAEFERIQGFFTTILVQEKNVQTRQCLEQVFKSMVDKYKEKNDPNHINPDIDSAQPAHPVSA